MVLARQRVRSIARLLGFDVQDQTRLATATSEIARNAYEYARGGQVDFVLEGQSAPQILLVRVSDNGPGIREMDRVRTISCGTIDGVLAAIPEVLEVHDVAGEDCYLLKVRAKDTEELGNCSAIN